MGQDVLPKSEKTFVRRWKGDIKERMAASIEALKTRGNLHVAIDTATLRAFHCAAVSLSYVSDDMMLRQVVLPLVECFGQAAENLAKLIKKQLDAYEIPLGSGTVLVSDSASAFTAHENVAVRMQGFTPNALVWSSFCLCHRLNNVAADCLPPGLKKVLMKLSGTWNREYWLGVPSYSATRWFGGDIGSDHRGPEFHSEQPHLAARSVRSKAARGHSLRHRVSE